METRNHFNALLSYYTAGKRLPDELRLQYWDALMQYGFTQELPENLDPLVHAVMDGMIPTIDISWKRARVGKQGGTKSKPFTKQTGSKPEANVKQTGSKPKAEKGGRRKEKGERIETPPFNPPSKGVTPSPKKKRKHPIPSDWQPSNPSIATQYNLDPVAASQYFIDWAIASGKTYTDWDRVWANACKSWLQEKPALRPGNAIQQSSTLEKVDYAEPAGWRGFVSRTYPEATVSRIEEDFDNDWDNLPASMKETITQDMSNE